MAIEEVARRPSYSEGVAFGVLSFGSIAVIGLASGIVTARLYGIEVVGQFALASAPFMLLNHLSSAREQAALVRDLAALERRSPRVTGLFGAVLAFSTGLTVLVAIPMSLAAYYALAGPIGQPGLVAPALALIAGYVMIGNLSWNMDMVFSAFREGRSLFWVRVDQAATFLVIATIGGVIWGSLWSLVAATAIAWATALIHRGFRLRLLMRYVVPRDELRSGFRALPDMVRFGLKIAPGTVADGLATQAGTWILGLSAPVAAVGAYSRAWNLGSRFVELNYRITEILFPTLVERRSSGDAAGFARALVDSMRYAGAGMFLPAAVGGGAAYGVMSIYGPGFEQGADALAVLLVAPALLSISAIAGHALTALDRPLTGSGTAVGRTALIVALTAVLAPRMGPSGAAVGLVAPYAVEVVLRTWLLSRQLPEPLRRSLPIREIAAPLMAYGSAFAAARFLDLSTGNLLGLLAALVGGSLVYGGVLLALGGLNDRDRRRLASLRERLGRQRAHVKTAPR